MKTHNSLGIIWDQPEGQIEVEGIEFYALTKQSEIIPIETIKNIWPSDMIDIQMDKYRYDLWTVLICTLRIFQWPNDKMWIEYLVNTMEAIINTGAIVVWSGGEDCTWNPEILTPESTMGNIYAGYSVQTGLLCNSNLSDELQFLNDDQVQLLHDVVFK